MGLRRLLDRIGGVILSPRRTFEIITLEGYDHKESITLSVLNGIYVFTLMFKQYSLKSLLLPLIIMFLWFFFITLGHLIITSIYKMPGSLSEFLHVVIYSTVTLILLLPIRVAGDLSVILFIFWLIWFNVVMYYAFRAYYRIDVKQYLVILFNASALIFFFYIVIREIALYYGIGVIA